MRAFIPAPPGNRVGIGPIQLNAYGLMIALGVLVAASVTARFWRQRGGYSDDVSAVLYVAVPAGVVGARIYHVITSPRQYLDHPFDVVKVWEGGLGIWGGVAVGAIVGWRLAKRRGLDATSLLDAAAVGLPLAQAVGRIGNWFNQELFGGPSTLPWALVVDAAKRPAELSSFTTFHPTFLYEAIWNVLVVAPIVWWVFGRSGLRGAAFASYVATYTFGRFWIERLRVDPATRLFGVRINELTSIVVFVTAVAWLVACRLSLVGRTSELAFQRDRSTASG